MPEPTPQVMLSTDEIQARIGSWPARSPAAIRPTRTCTSSAILKGAFLFLGDLIRAMDRHVTIDFMAVSSYAKGTTSSGEVRLIKDLDTGLEGRNVIIVEDIVDTGLTLAYLQEILRARGPQHAAHRLPAQQAVAAEGRREGGVHRASRSRTASWWATASITPNATATCRTSACSTRRRRPPP